MRRLLNSPSRAPRVVLRRAIHRHQATDNRRLSKADKTSLDAATSGLVFCPHEGETPRSGGCLEASGGAGCTTGQRVLHSGP